MRHFAGVDPDAARREAQHILSDRRFRSEPAPRPLRGPLHWIGDRVSGALDWLAKVLGDVPGIIWLVLGIAAVALAVWRIVVVANRRRVSAPARGARVHLGGEEVEDPDALDRAAGDAEREGDLERALRLRFRAGLIRLGDRGAITYRPSVTTGEVRRALHSGTFEDLAETFEAVAYGGREAGESDVAGARRDWPRVLEEARPR